MTILLLNNTCAGIVDRNACGVINLLYELKRLQERKEEKKEHRKGVHDEVVVLLILKLVCVKSK